MSVTLLPHLLSNGRVQVRIAWGADLTLDETFWTWEDVTSDVLQDNGSGITMTLGRGNGAQFAQPATCTLRLNNQNGAYTPASAVSFNYPFVRLGTPVQVRVSLNGGSSWSVRFQGEASAWSPGWDAQGKKAYVVLTSAGSTRRLGSGSKPLRSPLTRSILASTAATLSRYWPCEDGTTATQASTGLQSGPPLASNGSVQFGAMDLENQSDFTLTPGTTFGFQPQPRLEGGGTLSATFSGGSSSAWTVQSVIFCNPVQDNTQVVLFQWTEGGRTWQVTSDGITTDSVSLLVNGSVIASEPHIMISEDVRIDAAQSGGNINWSFKPMLAHAAITGSFAGTLGSVSSFTANPNATTTTGSLSVGQVRIWDGNSAADFKTSTQDTSAWNGYPGESATDRLTRLCGEENVTLDITGSSTTTMGVQGMDTFLNLLRECATADIGVLLDGLGPGLTYVCRTALYDQSAMLTVDANSGQVPATPGPQPTLDDQRLVNRITITNLNGSTVVFEDTDGPFGTAALGVFDNRATVNISDDADLVGIARWLVHIGTTEGMRYPQILVDLTAAPELAASWVDAIPSNVIELTNLGDRLPQHPGEDVSLLAEGWTEFVASRQWRVAVNNSNYRPWEVFKIGDSRLGRIQTGGSTVRSFATSTSTSIAVDNSSAGWSTAGLPFDVDIEGEQITVTAISGSTTPQTLTVTRSVNRVVKDHNTGAVVELWKPGVLAL